MKFIVDSVVTELLPIKEKGMSNSEISELTGLNDDEINNLQNMPCRLFSNG